jgi:hypothetical protein
MLAKIAAALFLAAFASASDPLASGFLSPPPDARPRAFYPWVNGNTDLAEITRELEQARAKGIGGFDIWDVSAVVDFDKVVPAGPPFMGPESTHAIAHTIREAGRLGLDIGIIVSSGWDAGGSWVSAEHATKGLFRSHRIVEGPAPVTLDLPDPDLPSLFSGRYKPIRELGPDGRPRFWQEVALLAWPDRPDRRIQPSELVNLSGQRTWTPPPGRWRVTRYVSTVTGQPLYSSSPNSAGPMIDHLSPAATEFHFNYFLHRLSRELGPLSRTALKYLYTDSYEISGDLWTPLMLSEFRRRAGYDLVPWLPALDGYELPGRDRFQHDYRKVLSDLVIDNHYRKALEVCSRYGIGFVAEAAGPGAPIHQCPFESLLSSGVLSWPRGEFWHKYTNPNHHSDAVHVIKGVASSAHIYDKKYVEAEALSSIWMFQEGPRDVKPAIDRAFADGLNRVVFHTFPHTPKAAGRPGWVYAFGTQISEELPWWPMADGYIGYISRASFLLQQGHFVGDVLYYYGDRAPNFVPPKHVDPDLGFGFEADWINTDVLLNRLSVRNGKLVLPQGPQYEVLVLPEENPPSGIAWNPAVQRRIDELRKQGALIVDPPSRRTQSLRDILTARGIVPDFSPSLPSAAESLDFIHRRTNGADIYFVVNKTASPLQFAAQFRVPPSRRPELWDPVTGAIQFASLPLSLAPQQSLFVVFRDKPTTVAAPLAPSSLAAAPVNGPWSVTFREALPQPITIRMDQLSDWTAHSNPEIRDYAGVAEYRTSFQLSKQAARVWLETGPVESIARVFVNGRDCGTSWSAPYRVEIAHALKPGDNTLVIEVANLWPNRLIADAKLPPAQRRTRTSVTRLPTSWGTPLAQLPDRKTPLLPSGLFGPVRLLSQPRMP